MKPSVRLTELDLLRFVAAFAVMFFHYTTRGNADPNLIPIQYPFLSQISRYCYLGVDLFFIISGFVIFMSAVDRSPKSFAISRIVRLYPAYWVSCTLTFLVTLFWGVNSLKVSWPVYAANLTMLHSFFNIEHVDGVYWSLFVEIKFYMMVLMVILLKQMHRARYFLGLWLLVSMLSLKFPISRIEEIFITPHSAYFISGAIFYLIWKEGLDLYKGMLLLGSYVLALCNAMGMMNIVQEWYHIELDVVIVAVWVTVFYLMFFLMANNRLAFMRGRFLVVLGALTYPLYLVHERIGFIAFKSFAGMINRHLLLVLVMAGMCGVAYVINVCIEQRFSPVFKKFLEAKLKFIP